MLSLLIATVINALSMIFMMAITGVEVRYVIGFTFSFMGLFVFGFQYLWHDSRLFYYKKVKTEVDLSDIERSPINQSKPDTSQTFVTKDGKLLF